MSYSRWVTTANRIMRFYVACNMPSTAMKELLAYIINGLCSFQYGLLIKSKPILQTVLSVSSAFIQKLSVKPLSAVNKILQRNAFNDHTENRLQ